MKIYTKDALDDYLKNDYILEVLERYPEDKDFASHRWLLDMSVKRMIYADVYGILLKERGKHILDVGGGFCGLSRELIARHDYTLIDIMTHDNHARTQDISARHGNFWIQRDWHEVTLKKSYDYIIANDLFPNVDQRVKRFIELYKPHAKTLIITLTCNDRDISYTVKRLDAEEILTVVPWTRRVTEEVLREALHDESITLPEPSDTKSLFKNGRMVYCYSS